MRKLYALALLTAFALPLTAPSAQAQGFSFIPHLGYNLDAESFLVGVGGEFDAPFSFANLVLGIRPSIEYVFVDDGGFNDADFSLLQVNGDVIARFGAPGAGIAPFAGAGLAVLLASVDIDCDGDPFCEEFEDDAGSTDFGLNIVGGAEFPGALSLGAPFVQGRLTLADGTAFSIIGGLVIPLGQ